MEKELSKTIKQSMRRYKDTKVIINNSSEILTKIILRTTKRSEKNKPYSRKKWKFFRI